MKEKHRQCNYNAIKKLPICIPTMLEAVRNLIELRVEYKIIIVSTALCCVTSHKASRTDCGIMCEISGIEESFYLAASRYYKGKELSLTFWQTRELKRLIMII